MSERKYDEEGVLRDIEQNDTYGKFFDDQFNFDEEGD